MPFDESLQHKLDRVRRPRVQITYDVEIGDATVKKELPFVLGVLADLSGHPEEPLPPLKERKFLEINRDNFDRIMAGMKPRLAMKVDNALQKDGTKLGVELRFRRIEDFEPENVVRQVEPMRRLLEARQRLADLKTKIIANDRLDQLLQQHLAEHHLPTDQRSFGDSGGWRQGQCVAPACQGGTRAHDR